MKIRKGFVSNSSSSSFVCDVSGEITSGWDLSIYDAEMYNCEHNHTFLDIYLLNKEKFDKWVEKDDIDDYRWDLPSEYCPICQMRNIIKDDAILYLLKRCNISLDDLTKEIKDNYDTYTEFKDDLK